MSNSTFGRCEFRSASDVSREHLLFELMDGMDNIILSMGMSEAGRIEIWFEEAATGRALDLAQVGEWIARGKELIFEDLAEDAALNE